MLLKKCTKPFCGKVFREEDEQFHDGFCDCGFELIDYDPKVEQEAASTAEPEMIDQAIEVEETLETQETVNDAQSTVEATMTEEQDVDFHSQEKPEIDEEAQPTLTAAIDTSESTAISSSDEEDIIDGPAYIIREDGTLVFPEDEVYQDAVRELQEKDDFLKHDPYKEYKGNRIVAFYEGDSFRTFPLEYDESIIGRESKGQKADIDLTAIDPERKISRRHALVYRYNNQFYIRNLSSKNPLYVNRTPIAQNEEALLEDESTIVLSGRYGLIFYAASEAETDE